jgi:hypothetical protein
MAQIIVNLSGVEIPYTDKTLVIGASCGIQVHNGGVITTVPTGLTEDEVNALITEAGIGTPQLPANVVTADSGGYLYLNGVKMPNLAVAGSMLVEDTVEVANGLTVDADIHDVNGGLFATQTWVTQQAYAKQADLVQHASNDATSWAMVQGQISDLQNQIADLKASIQNEMLSGTSTDITNMTYTVDSALGGRITGKGTQTLGLLGIVVAATGTVTVNGTTVYDNTTLLSVGATPTLNADVPNGAIIVSSGMASLTFTPYIPTA